MTTAGERWGNPYVTFASPGYFVCWDCGVDILGGDLIQRVIAKGSKVARHYDCDDVTGSQVLMQVRLGTLDRKEVHRLAQEPRGD